MGRRKHAALGEEEPPVNEEQKLALDKIKELSAKIHKIHEERKRSSPMSRFNNPTNLNASTVSKKSTHSKKNKRVFYHPNLDYVYAEVTNSPYLTPPNKNYSKETLYTSSKLRKLKVSNQGKPLRDIQDCPCDVEKAEEDFVHKVIEYQPLFDMMKDTAPKVIGLHDPPRPGFIVYPNKYKPLVGHTGKISHVEPYLLFNPEVKYEPPPDSNGILTMADYKRYLKQLNAKVDAPKRLSTVMRQMSSRTRSTPKSDREDGASSIDASLGLASFNQEEDFESTPAPIGDVLGGSRPSSRPSSARLQPLHDPQCLDNRPSTSPSMETPPTISRSNSNSHQVLQRQGSGTYQAHTGRAGPEHYLSQIAVQKSYKQFIRTFSKDGIDGEEENMRSMSRGNSFRSVVSRDNSFCSVQENDEKEKDKDNNEGSQEKEKEKENEIHKNPPVMKKKKGRSKRTSVCSFDDVDAKSSENPITPSASTDSKQQQKPKRNSCDALKQQIAEAKSSGRDDDDKVVDDGKDTCKIVDHDEKKDDDMIEKASSKDQPNEFNDPMINHQESKAESKTSDDIQRDVSNDIKDLDHKKEEEEKGKKVLLIQTSASKDEDADLSIYQDDDDFESCTSQKIADNDEHQQESQGGVRGGLLSPLSLDQGDNDMAFHDNNLDGDDDQDTNAMENESKDGRYDDDDDDDLRMPLGLDTKSMILSSETEEGKENEKNEKKFHQEEKSFEEEEKDKSDREYSSEYYNDEDFEQEEELKEQKRQQEEELKLKELQKQNEHEDEQPKREEEKEKEKEELMNTKQKGSEIEQNEDEEAYEEDDFEPLSASNSPEKKKVPATSSTANDDGGDEDMYDLSDDD